MRIDAAGLTDVGKVRTNNEDSFFCDADLGLFMVADGMGGHNAGEIASKQTIEIIHQNILKISTGAKKVIYGNIDKNLSEWANYLASSIRLANSVVFQAAQASPEKKGMGTTIVAVYYDRKKNVLSCANVGDSRIYCHSGRELKPLTSDHTIVAEQLKLGIITKEEAKVSQYQNILSRAIGAAETVEVDVSDIPARSGMSLLLCSDGLTRMVSDEAIEKIFSSMKNEASKDIARELIKAANENGGRDNITVCVVKFTKENILSKIFCNLC